VVLRLRNANPSTPSALVVRANFDGLLRYAISELSPAHPDHGVHILACLCTEWPPQFQLSETDLNRLHGVTVVDWNHSGKIQCLGCAYPSEYSPPSQPTLRHRIALPSRCCLCPRILCSFCESNSNVNTPSTSRLWAIKESVALINQKSHQNPVLP
jgi:hypothetical protein